MYKINIPQPCHEKWEEMTPQGNGSFCGQCSKVVVDFTAMSDDEVQNYFIENAHQKLCGRFKAEQIENVQIQIPSYLIYIETSFLKKFILISLVVFGTTLYSCTDSNGTVKGKTEFVVNSKDTVPADQQITLGKIAPLPVDTPKKSCSPDNKNNIEILGEVAIFNPADTVKKVTISDKQVVMGAPIMIDSIKKK
jgi:hypothetical protein